MGEQSFPNCQFCSLSSYGIWPYGLDLSKSICSGNQLIQNDHKCILIPLHVFVEPEKLLKTESMTQIDSAWPFTMGHLLQYSSN